MATTPAATAPTAAQDVQVVNPNLNQGRDYTVPKQTIMAPELDAQGKPVTDAQGNTVMVDTGNSIITGKKHQSALDVFETQQAEAAEPNFDWAVPEEIHPPKVAAKPVLPPAHDPKAEINWHYNPQDDFVPAGRPATKAGIAGFTPGLKDYNPYDPEPRLEDGLQPHFAWDPSKETPPANPQVAPGKPVLPPKDDVEANMAEIWTPDPVYLTARGTK